MLFDSCYSEEQRQLLESKKPTLTERQVNLLNAFYKLSQERSLEQGSPLSIKDKDIYFYIEKNGSYSMPEDLFIKAIHEIDSEYIKQRCEEMRRKASKGK